jgi:hypothetical protein
LLPLQTRQPPRAPPLSTLSLAVTQFISMTGKVPSTSHTRCQCDFLPLRARSLQPESFHFKIAREIEKSASEEREECGARVTCHGTPASINKIALILIRAIKFVLEENQLLLCI